MRRPAPPPPTHQGWGGRRARGRAQLGRGLTQGTQSEKQRGKTAAALRAAAGIYWSV